MHKREHIYLVGLILMTMLTFRNVAAQYNFLGNVQKYQTSDSGIRLYCADGYQLNIVFLQANIFRVFLLRPDFQEVPLDYPLVKIEWSPVELEVRETQKQFVVASSELDIIIQKAPCRLTVRDKFGNVLSQDDPGLGIGWDGKEIRNWKTLAADEKFFGLGEKTGPLNKRGSQWVLWNTDDPHHDNHSDPLYQSIPFFIGMRQHLAYGIYFNNSYRSTFNFGAGNQRYYSFTADAGNLDYFFIYGPAVRRVVESYTALTGRTQMPPKWTLGYQQCRWSYYPDSEVLRIARTFREKKIPADVIYLDIHYMDGYRVFTWHPERFPDPAGLIRKLSQMGFKVVVIIDPGVKADPNYDVAQSGLKGEHFVKYPDGEVYTGEVWPGKSYFPDFSRSETRDWWGRQFKRLLDDGVSGFWNDMNEPAVWGKAFPEEVLFSDEGRIASQKKIHNLYGFLMAKTNYDGVRKLRPRQRPFVITRAGFAGEQRFTSVWTGDNQATEEHLAMGIRMLQGLGLSGIPFVGTDVGGFGGTPSPELYARWLQSAVFTPFFRSHTHFGSPDQEPWSFGEQVEEISRKFISKRYEMLPYLYSLFWQSSQTGAPILRPMFWQFQGDERVYDPAYSEQFLIGDKLLLAPVTRVGSSLREVYLPQGRWWDMNAQRVLEGGREIVVPAPLDVLPQFLQEGGIIISRSVQQFSGESAADEIWVDIFPGPRQSRFELYEDDGESFDYSNGAYRLTRFQVELLDSGRMVRKERVHDNYAVAERRLHVRVLGVTSAPESVQLNGKAMPLLTEGAAGNSYSYDAATAILEVRFDDIGKKQELFIR